MSVHVTKHSVPRNWGNAERTTASRPAGVVCPAGARRACAPHHCVRFCDVLTVDHFCRPRPASEGKGRTCAKWATNLVENAFSVGRTELSMGALSRVAPG